MLAVLLEIAELDSRLRAAIRETLSFTHTRAGARGGSFYISNGRRRSRTCLCARLSRSTLNLPAWPTLFSFSTTKLLFLPLGQAKATSKQPALVSQRAGS